MSNVLLFTNGVDSAAARASFFARQRGTVVPSRDVPHMGKEVGLDRRPRVFFLTNVPAPYRLPVFEALAEHVDLTVFFCEAQDPARPWEVDLRSERVCYDLLSTRRLSLPGGMAVIWNPGLRMRLRRTPFDVYIAGENFTSFPAVLSVLKAAQRRNRPFVVWSEAIDTPYASGHFLSNAYRRWLYRRTDAFIAYCQKAKEYLVRRGVSPDRINSGLQVIPAEQLPTPAADKAALGLTRKRVVLYMGHFEARKGIDVLVDAFRVVAGTDDVLALVGSGPEGSRLRAATHGDPRIVFTGYLQGSVKTSWYAAADLFVLPTLHDPWGLVVNEAMAFGLPVIVTDAAGSTDLVQDNGYVVQAGDVDALASALARLLDDAPLRRKMGQRSRAIIANYTVDAACEAFLRVIVLALKGGGNGSDR